MQELAQQAAFDEPGVIVEVGLSRRPKARQPQPFKEGNECKQERNGTPEAFVVGQQTA